MTATKLAFVNREFFYEVDTGSKSTSEPPSKKSCIDNCFGSEGNEGLLTNKEVTKKIPKTVILRAKMLGVEGAQFLLPTGGSLLFVR